MSVEKWSFPRSDYSTMLHESYGNKSALIFSKVKMYYCKPHFAFTRILLGNECKNSKMRGNPLKNVYP